MILTPEIIAIFLLNTLFLIFGVIAFWISIKIFFQWDIQATTPLQYTLEKQSFLSSTIIKYIFIFKIFLFLFFIFTLDKLSTSITGAMCAVGVVDATPYGTPLFVLKIINLYLFGFWLVFHSFDLKASIPRYTKLKFSFFIPLFILFVSEIFLESLMFYSLDISKMVSCCGTLFSSTSNSYISTIFLIKIPLQLALFYGTFLSLFLFYFFKKHSLFTIFNLLFLIISLITLISFFGTYIYELPTHHCPFCFLQKDYYYVGYLLYTLLFLGTFYGLLPAIIQKNLDKNFQKSLFFNSLYTTVVTLYPLIYYLKNGVWL